MTKDVLKTILAGIILGTTIFIMPLFIVQLFVFILVMKIVSKLLGFHSGNKFWKKYQNMSEEEKAAFKEKFKHHCSKFNAENA